MTELKVFLDRMADEAKIYDVTERALAAGKRRRRVRRLAVPSGAAAAVGAVVAAVALAGGGPTQLAGGGPNPPAAPTAALPDAPPTSPAADPFPTRCVAERLPTPKGHGSKSVVTGGDPSGRYLVGRSYPGGKQDRVVIWRDGRVAQVVAMEGSDQDLHDINSAGTAVGSSYVGPFQKETRVAWAVVGGKAVRLPGGGDSVALAINDAGVIVGAVGERPAVWRSYDARPEFLPVPDKGLGVGVGGIDEDGTIVATFSGAVRGDHRLTAQVFRPDGSVRTLAPVPTVEGRPATGASAGPIRDGLVYGSSVAHESDEITYEVGTVWDARTGAVVRTLPAVRGGNHIDRHGWVVGVSRDGPVLTTGDRTVLLPPAEGTATDDEFAAFEVTALSDNGIVGGYQSAEGEKRSVVAVRWVCA